MKIVLYNIAYGTGSPGGEYRRLFTSHHYLAAPERPFRKIANFIAAVRPDAVCLVEADLGSARTGGGSQPEQLAEMLKFNSFSQTKYAPRSPLSRLPYWKFQGNAILCRDMSCQWKLDFLPRGTKKLILSARIAGIRLVLVHLALTQKVRAIQLEYLAETLRGSGPCVLAGDLNTFKGQKELNEFIAKTGFHSANLDGHPTYPAWEPQKELDYLLLSPELEAVSFSVPHLQFSDHLPLIADVRIR